MDIPEFIKYAKQTWANKPSYASPITAERLNHIEQGIATNNQLLKELIEATTQLNSDITMIYAIEVKDLNNPPPAFILNTTVNPEGMPNLNGNACLVIQQNPGSTVYTAQLAFSFGTSKIAIRYKRTSDWTAWQYFTASS